MENKTKEWKRGVSIFIFAVILIVIYKTIDNFGEIFTFIKNLFDIMLPFLLGILIAYILYVPAKKFETAYAKSKNKFIAKKSRGLRSIYDIYNYIDINNINYELYSASYI